MKSAVPLFFLFSMALSTVGIDETINISTKFGLVREKISSPQQKSPDIKGAWESSNAFHS
jgi:hypothetical protein